MFCTNCGNNLQPNAKFCNVCGTPVVNQANPQPAPTYTQPQPTYTQPVYTQPQPTYTQPVYTQPAPAMSTTEPLSWKEFFNRFVSKKSRSLVTWMVVICFVTTAISLAFGFLFEEAMADAILDVAVYLLSGILLLATKHWLFVLIPTIYGGIWTVIGIATDGSPTGVAALAIGVGCLGMLFKATAAYKKYKNEGILPENPL